MDIKRDEAWLRGWLRAGWDDTKRGPLGWIEPGRGGTVGMPDCLLPINGLWIPAELKATKAPLAQYKFKTRGAQFRFHKLAARAGYLTCYIVACSDGIMAFPFVDALQIAKHVRGMPVVTINQLVVLLNSKDFWAMQPVKRHK